MRTGIRYDDSPKLRDFSDGTSCSKGVDVLMNRLLTISDEPLFLCEHVSDFFDHVLTF